MKNNKIAKKGEEKFKDENQAIITKYVSEIKSKKVKIV
jgi:hypothetical protein